MVDQPILSDSLLRLCECRAQEVQDAAQGARGALLHSSLLGTALCCRWDPTHPRRVGVLYSSGVLRLWDVAVDAYRDFSLYLPAQGLPVPTASESSDFTDRSISSLMIADRRAATTMTHFDFLPLVGPSGSSAYDAQGLPSTVVLPRIVFGLKRSNAVYFSELPHQAGEDSDHYLSGSRVYELPSRLPATVSALALWRCGAFPMPMAALAVGCEDGHVGVWLISQAFNPETAVSMRSKRDASPAFLRGAADPFTSIVAAAGASSSSSSSSSSCSAGAAAPFVGLTVQRVGEPAVNSSWTAKAHAGRVRQLVPLHLKRSCEFAEDADAAAESHDSRNSATTQETLRTGPSALRAAIMQALQQQQQQSTAFAPIPQECVCDNIFLSSGDDGRVKLWRLEVAPSAAVGVVPAYPLNDFMRGAGSPPGTGTGAETGPGNPFHPSLAPAAVTASSPFKLSLVHYGTLPTDATPVTALASIAWPVADKNQAGILGLHNGNNNSSSNSGQVTGGRHTDTLRALVACGNREGVLTLWEVLVPAIDSTVMALPTTSEDQTARFSPGAFFSYASGQRFPSPDPFATTTTTAMLRGTRPKLMRLIGMASVNDDLDPVTGVSLMITRTRTAIATTTGHTVAVGGADGRMSIFRLEGTGDIASANGEDGQYSAGSAGPVTLVYQGASSPPPLSPLAANGASGSSSSAFDILRSFDREAAALAALSEATSSAEQQEGEQGQEQQQQEGVSSYSGAKQLRAAASSLAEGHPHNSAMLRHRRTVTTALTAAAVANLQRSLVTVAFNEHDWPGDDEEADDEGDDDPDAAVIGALMACNGSGELMLWPRDALPGAGEGGIALASSAAAEASGLSGGLQIDTNVAAGADGGLISPLLSPSFFEGSAPALAGAGSVGRAGLPVASLTPRGTAAVTSGAAQRQEQHLQQREEEGFGGREEASSSPVESLPATSEFVPVASTSAPQPQPHQQHHHHHHHHHCHATQEAYAPVVEAHPAVDELPPMPRVLQETASFKRKSETGEQVPWVKQLEKRGGESVTTINVPCRTMPVEHAMKRGRGGRVASADDDDGDGDGERRLVTASSRSPRSISPSAFEHTITSEDGRHILVVGSPKKGGRRTTSNSSSNNKVRRGSIGGAQVDPATLEKLALEAHALAKRMYRGTNSNKESHHHHHSAVNWSFASRPSADASGSAVDHHHHRRRRPHPQGHHGDAHDDNDDDPRSLSSHSFVNLSHAQRLRINTNTSAAAETATNPGAVVTAAGASTTTTVLDSILQKREEEIARSYGLSPSKLSAALRHTDELRFGGRGGQDDSDEDEAEKQAARASSHQDQHQRPPPGSSPDHSFSFSSAAAASGGRVHPPRSRSGSLPRSSSSRRASVSSVTTTASRLADNRGLRNPARLAAALLKEAREDSRVSIRLARETASAVRPQTETTGDEHPDALATFSRVIENKGRNVGEDDDKNHHLIAPVVGSSSAIAAEIQRLQSLQFDEEAALSRALEKCGVAYDRRVEEEVKRRRQYDASGSTVELERGVPFDASGQDNSTEGKHAAEEDEEEELAYVPTVRTTSSANPRPPGGSPSSATVKGNKTASRMSRLLKPLESKANAKAGAAGTATTVSQGDILKWHLKGTR